MKTSSITLITVICLALAATFFFPALSMKRVEIREISISATGQSVEVTTGFFVTLEIHNPAYLGVPGPDALLPLSVRISSSDTVTRPRLVMDRTWSEMANVALRHDTLFLAFNPPQPDPDTLYSVAPDAAHICDIIVPQGMMRSVNPYENLTLTLSGLRQPSLAIGTDTPCRLTSCSIDSLSLLP